MHLCSNLSLAAVRASSDCSARSFQPLCFSLKKENPAASYLEMSSTLVTSPTEQQANAPIATTTMDAKLMVATASGDVQHLKDLLVNKEEQDPKMVVVVMAKQPSMEKSHPQQGNMDPHLLALASSGSAEKLQALLDLSREESQVVFGSCMDGSLLIQRAYDDTEAITVEGVAAKANDSVSSVCASSSEKPQTLFNEEEGGQACTDGAEGSLRASDDMVKANEAILEGIAAEGDTAALVSSEKLQTLINTEKGGQACGNNGRDDGSLHMRRACDDIEANELILEGVTAQGDTALHVVTASGQGDNFFTRFREAKHLLVVQQNNSNNRRRPTRAERHALTTYGDSDNFLESACIIYGKAKHLLFVQNKNGDTPLHCAARAGKSNMVACLIDLAFTEGENRMKELLRKENGHKETALHEAVRVGNKDIVDLLMGKDSELASFPQDGGASPLYLAIVLKRDLIQATLYDKSSDGKLFFSGPNGQNALHAAVLRYKAQGLTKLLEWIETHPCPQNKDHVTTQRDENGSTPLHFAAARSRKKKPSRICRQVLEANPYTLYQPDHAGFFPIHVAASVGASSNVDMFVTKYPGSASLRDANGRTFLHVAVEKRKANVISSACNNLSLSWIMNMVDNDGNTALHLAVEAGSLQMFCALLRNPQVNLNLPNSRGETPLDIAHYKIPRAVYYSQSSEAQIVRTLRIAGAVHGVHRWDHLEDNKTQRVKHDESKEMDVLKDSAGTLCIVSVLIATVSFGATFAVPGGYIADDHNNGGSPVLARRYAFDAFVASNTLAFVFSTMATIGLMRSGTPLFNPRSRIMHLRTAFILVSFSITCLTAAFALGAYVVLAPVSHKTAVATCVLTPLVLLYNRLEFIVTHLLLLPPLCTRKGPIWAWVLSPMTILGNMLLESCLLLLIFGWAVYANRSPKTLAPAPLA